jgi:hypothetical protein
MPEMQQTDRQTQTLINVHHYKYRVWNLRSPSRQRLVQNELFTCTVTFSYIYDWTNLRTWKRWSTLLIWKCCILRLKQKATTLLDGKYVCLVVSGHNSKLYLFLIFSEESQALQPYLQDILCDFSDIHDNSPSQSHTQTLSHTKTLSKNNRHHICFKL